jgi:hypothetical protein
VVDGDASAGVRRVRCKDGTARSDAAANCHDSTAGSAAVSLEHAAYRGQETLDVRVSVPWWLQVYRTVTSHCMRAWNSEA